MKYLALAAVLLAGCAATPEQMAQRSNWDVCRFTMGGPHAKVAESEAQRRGLDCQPLYPAISAQLQNQNAATANFLRSIKPPPAAPRPAIATQTSCRSYRVGDQIRTDCN